MTHFKDLADTMYQLSDTMGDHHWQAGRAIDLLLLNSEQHVYAARMMATAVLVAAKRLGIARQDLDGLSGAQICHLLADIERMATVGEADRADAVRYRKWRDAMIVKDAGFIQDMAQALPPGVGVSNRPTAQQWDTALDEVKP